MKVWAALEAGKRFVLLVAHRRWGKDEVLLRWKSVQAARKAANYFYMLPEAEHVRRAIWTSINAHTGRRRIEEAFPEELVEGSFKEQEMAIPTVTGSRVQFLGSDNYDQIVGAGPFGLGFSEWALADPQAFALLRPVLVENGGWAVFLTTARGKNHVYTMMKEMAGEKDWAIFLESAETTGVFTKEQLETERRLAVALYGPEVGESLFRQEYFCTFEDIVPGSFYGDLMEAAQREGRVGEVLWDKEAPVYAAFDIGYSQSTAVWYAQVRQSGWVDLLGYEEYRRKTTGDIAQILKTHPWTYGALLLPHDAVASEVTSGETFESILKKFGFTTVLMPRTDEQPQVTSVRALLPRCRFHEEATERGRTCLKAYHQKRLEDRQDWSLRAVHDWSSHGCKAFATLAYFAPSLRAGGRPREVLTMLPSRRGFDDAPSGTGWMR